ncbi:hypothetical protein D3C84_398040 [compost metagenome]
MAQSVARGEEEAAVEEQDHRDVQHQAANQQQQVPALVDQALVEQVIEKADAGFAQLPQALQRLAVVAVELPPGRIQAVCFHHALDQALQAALQRLFASLRHGVQRGDGQLRGGQRQGIVGLRLFQPLQEVAQAVVVAGRDEALDQRGAAHRQALAEQGRGLRQRLGQQFADLAHLALAVQRQFGLGGDESGEHLLLAEQPLDARRLGLAHGRLLQLGSGVQQGLLPVLERLPRLGFAGQRT